MDHLPPAQLPKSSATPAINARTSAQLPPRFARAGDGSVPAFAHLCWLPALPDRWAWAPLPWTGRLTLGAGVAWVPATVPGRVSWDRLYNGAYRLPQLLSRICLLPPNLL